MEEPLETKRLVFEKKRSDQEGWKREDQKGPKSERRGLGWRIKAERESRRGAGSF